MVDKPFTVTLSQARELESLAKHCGRILSVFHNRRWDSDFLTVSALINEGQLGEVCCWPKAGARSVYPADYAR